MMQRIPFAGRFAAVLTLIVCSGIAASRPAAQQKTPQSSGRASTGTTAADAVKLAPWTGDLDGMIKRRLIRVATTYNKTNYFIDKGVQRGAVYESFKLF